MFVLTTKYTEQDLKENFWDILTFRVTDNDMISSQYDTRILHYVWDDHIKRVQTHVTLTDGPGGPGGPGGPWSPKEKYRTCNGDR